MPAAIRSFHHTWYAINIVLIHANHLWWQTRKLHYEAENINVKFLNNNNSRINSNFNSRNVTKKVNDIRGPRKFFQEFLVWPIKRSARPVTGFIDRDSGFVSLVPWQDGRLVRVNTSTGWGSMFQWLPNGVRDAGCTVARGTVYPHIRCRGDAPWIFWYLH
jgi:hypothetical protein